ncbi:acyltransferase [Aeromicrobium sp. 179-A 4D2 NHS]|uniref:acyltransferase n=1 Tax=Aeromicrobium sp. 179-A 4D2 NHS TaxID=3142375 RepID=UPI0039A3CBC1
MTTWQELTRTDEAMTPEHRARLVEAGVDPDRLDALAWRRLDGPLPSWWNDLGNALYAAPGAMLPDRVVELLTTFYFHDALIVVGGPMEHLTSLLVGGDGATVFLDERVILTAGEIYCGPRSSVVLHGPVVATRSPVIDARNGGSIVAAGDQLWAAGVYIATDDMHRLEDAATGERINPFGATIRLGHHVWLCRESVVSGHVEIGDHVCVGLRAVVRGQKVPANVVVAGSPARVVREGTTWSFDDTP